MQDVLEVYHRPHDPDHPVVCVDETSKQLIAETRVPIAAKPGRPKRYDYEYERNGTANLFMMFAPLEGWRHVKVTDRRIANQQTLTEEVAAWENHRNNKHATADWQFTTADARIKLKRLYPAS